MQFIWNIARAVKEEKNKLWRGGENTIFFVPQFVKTFYELHVGLCIYIWNYCTKRNFMLIQD